MISKKKLTLQIIAVLLLILFIYSYYSYHKIRVGNTSADEFSQDLISVMRMDAEFVMADVTDFEWDAMIIFEPYTSKVDMEGRLGQKWTTYSYIEYHLVQKTFLGDYPLDDDSLNKLVFINGNDIVLDVTFTRRDVDLTQLPDRIHRGEAQFDIQNNIMRLAQRN